MPRKHKQDIVASLRGILATVAVILAFIVFLTAVVIVERWVLG